MRLGVVLTGIGACAAASAGALTWLLDAGVAPYAVCGMQAAAWPAALYLVGYDADRLRGAAVQAARAGRLQPLDLLRVAAHLLFLPANRPYSWFPTLDSGPPFMV